MARQVPDPPTEEEKAKAAKLKERFRLTPDERVKEEAKKKAKEEAAAAADAALRAEAEEKKRVEDAEEAELARRLQESDLNEDKVMILKEAGGTAYKNGLYHRAIEFFTRAISYDHRTSHALHSSRSACKSALKDFQGALEDAKIVISLVPESAKGYTRQAAALHGLHRWNESIHSYEEAQARPAVPLPPKHSPPARSVGTTQHV